MSLNPKVATYIGFSIKARKIVYGYESVIAAGKKIRLILCSDDLSENSLKKVRRFADEVAVPFVVVEELAEYFGGKKIKCVGLVEEHLASATAKELLKVGGSNR